MKKLILLLAVTATCYAATAQKYMSRNGVISFYSKTPLEDIKATNNQVYAVIDGGSKNLAFFRHKCERRRLKRKISINLCQRIRGKQRTTY